MTNLTTSKIYSPTFNKNGTKSFSQRRQIYPLLIPFSPTPEGVFGDGIGGWSVVLGGGRSVWGQSSRSVRSNCLVAPVSKRLDTSRSKPLGVLKGFVCFFVCCYKTRKSLHCLPLWARNKTTESICIRAVYLFLRSYQRCTTAQNYSLCQLRLILYKVTGWLASLDLRKLYTNTSSATE